MGIRAKADTSGRYRLREQIEVQSMVIPVIVFLAIFAYIPMYGVVTAFQEYNIVSGFGSGKWVGLKYFRQFITDPNLFNVVRNTLAINGLGLVLGFPAPILLALLLNEIQNTHYKKLCQTVSYLPHFLSWVIFGGIVLELLSMNGIFNRILVFVGLLDKPVNWMGKGESFWMVFTLASIMKTLGYGSILYVAAISGIDQEMYEAAIIDGCNRFQKIIHITLPAIVGTIVIMLIFQLSAILNTGYEQILIFQNSLNSAFSETLDTYVYKIGMQQQRFSYATAVGLLKSVISVGLLLSANWISKKITDRGLF